MWMGERTVSEKEDIPKLEKLYAQMIKEKQPFQRLEVTREQLLEMFKHNPFKQRLIQERNIGDTTVYRCGNLIDMCRGPHLPHTGKAKSVSLYKTSATYWEGKLKRNHSSEFMVLHSQIRKSCKNGLNSKKRLKRETTEKLELSKSYGSSIPSQLVPVSGCRVAQSFIIDFKIFFAKNIEREVLRKL